jgi:hypothetical protein
MVKFEFIVDYCTPPIIFELAPSESLDLHCGNKIAIQSRAAADPA